MPAKGGMCGPCTDRKSRGNVDDKVDQGGPSSATSTVSPAPVVPGISAATSTLVDSSQTAGGDSAEEQTKKRKNLAEKKKAAMDVMNLLLQGAVVRRTDPNTTSGRETQRRGVAEYFCDRQQLWFIMWESATDTQELFEWVSLVLLRDLLQDRSKQVLVDRLVEYKASGNTLGSFNTDTTVTARDKATTQVAPTGAKKQKNTKKRPPAAAKRHPAAKKSKADKRPADLPLSSQVAPEPPKKSTTSNSNSLFTTNGDSVWPPRAEQGPKTGIQGSHCNHTNARSKPPQHPKKAAVATSTTTSLPDLTPTARPAAPATSASSDGRASNVAPAHPFAVGDIRVMPSYALELEPYPLLAYHGLSPAGHYQFYVGPDVSFTTLTNYDVSFEWRCEPAHVHAFDCNIVIVARFIGLFRNYMLVTHCTLS